MSLPRLARAVALLAGTAAIMIGCVPVQAPAPATDEQTMAQSPAENVIAATFICPDGTALDTIFDNDAHTVTLDLPDGTVTLPQTVSGSGARYSDDVTTFWNKGDEAMVEVNGEIVYQTCVAE
jgi:membrane-bound inhibitor of C-type lysozyme